jgi:hypothetical protein
MAQIDWNAIMNPNAQPQKKLYGGANVRFFNAYNENKEKTLKEGRPIFDEIPSISIRYPGQDETVRKIEPHDIAAYPEAYAAFMVGNEPVTSGTPLSEWTPMNGSAMRELQHMGFRTVEQLAAATDDVKRRLGTLVRFVKMAKDWLDAASSPQAQVVSLREQLEREQIRTKKLEEQMHLLLMRIEATEGTRMTPERKEVIRSVSVEDDIQFDEPAIDEVPTIAVEPVRRRGRPKKV